jgi:hypothetical protein
MSAPSQVVVTNGQGGAVEFRTGDDLHVTNSIVVGEDADNVRHDVAAKRIYVGYGSGAIAVIDATDGRKLGEVPVGGHPESLQLEARGPRLFVNAPTARQIAVIDRSVMKLVATWPVTEAAPNYPMALDEAGHRLFIGCRRPARVFIVDTASGKTVGSVEAVGDTDDHLGRRAQSTLRDRRRRVCGCFSGWRPPGAHRAHCDGPGRTDVTVRAGTEPPLRRGAAPRGPAGRDSRARREGLKGCVPVAAGVGSCSE